MQNFTTIRQDSADLVLKSTLESLNQGRELARPGFHPAHRIATGPTSLARRGARDCRPASRGV
eukprot:scaffold20978_cov185-Isochrysis_galbana.AAC.1